MSALQRLAVYGSYDSSSESEEEEFHGFCESEQRVDQCRVTAFQAALETEQESSWESSKNLLQCQRSEVILNEPSDYGESIPVANEVHERPFIEEHIGNPLENLDLHEEPMSENEPNEGVSGSDQENIPEEGTSKPKKRTRKLIQQEDAAKRRRKEHDIKLIDCDCKRACVEKVGKDTRIDIHSRFWDLDSFGQEVFFKETVQLAPLKRRVKNRFFMEEPKKRKSYVFHLMADNERVEVCRKFYLNTIGYNENCG